MLGLVGGILIFKASCLALAVCPSAQPSELSAELDTAGGLSTGQRGGHLMDTHDQAHAGMRNMLVGKLLTELLCGWSAGMSSCAWHGMPMP